METIIYMNDAEKNIKHEMRRLEKKYESFDALRKKIINLKCEAPERQDDFMIWRYLRAATRSAEPERVEGASTETRPAQASPDPEVQDNFEGVTEEPPTEDQDGAQDQQDEESMIISFSEWLRFETFDIYLTLTPKRMELLDYINTKEPISVKELALGLERDYKNIYDDVLALSKYNLVDLQKVGRNKTPITRVDYIQVIPKKY